MGTTNSRPTTTLDEETRLSPYAKESFGANGAQNIIDSLLSWGPWQTITHLAVAVLFIYVVYVLITMPEQRTLTNLLLLLIALAVAVQIHQNINLQRKLLNGN